jgi:GAF domain-containing protein
LSKSEVVIPLFGADGEVKAVLDVDSDSLNDFDEIDVTYLSKLCALISVN